MAQPVYLPLVLLAAVVGMGVAFFAWLQSDRPGARPLTVFVVAASFWAVAEGLTVAAAGLDSLRFWTQVALTCSTVVPLAWLVTVLEYTGRERWLTRRRLALLLVEPGVFVVLVWTATDHSLVWTDATRTFLGDYSLYATEFGLAFWGHQAYSYLLVAAGGLLLVWTFVTRNELYRTQSTALLLAVAIPMVANAAYIFGALPRGLDPSGLAYVLSGIVLAVAVFRTQLLQIAPAVRELGREEMLTELDDCVYILAEDDRVVEANPAGAALLDDATDEYLGQPLSAVLPPLADALATGDSPLRLDVEGTVRYYDVQVSELSRGYGTLSGRLVSLRDVTEQRRREQRLDVLNRLFRHNIRNELNVVRGNVALARDTVEEERVEQQLTTAVETVDTIVDRSDKVGRLSRLFETEAGGTLALAEHLESELGSRMQEYPEATLSLSVPDDLRVAAGPTVTVAFDELVVNAIEHNDSAQPRVEVTVDSSASDDEFVVLTVSDDGPGIDTQEVQTIAQGRETPLEHTSGVGLWLANWVVEYHGGSLSFDSSPEGTVVSLRLPRASAADTRETAGNPDGDQSRPESTPDGGEVE